MPALSVIAPAYNQESTITGSITEIARRLDALGLDYELIVVSDGSTDATLDRLREFGHPRVRVTGYTRNLGKGYALRTGSALATGDLVAWIDSDLDLDPSLIDDFIAEQRRGGWDIVVGSKRHPDSTIDYPARRRAYSWMFQQLTHLLFRLDIRDTQVGMKLFRREVLDDVLPSLVVKRYAFDIEVLAVSRAFGHERMTEHPIALEYQFTGSGVNWRAIANALWDSAAIFYRLRVLRYYDRQHRLTERVRQLRRDLPMPSLTVALAPEVVDDGVRRTVDGIRRQTPDGTAVMVVTGADGAAQVEGATVTALPGLGEGARLAHAVRAARTDAVALLDSGSDPTGSWAGTAVALLAAPEVGAVVGPSAPDLRGSPASAAGGILSESRLGVGSARVRFHVGRLREVDDFPATNLFARTGVLRDVLDSGGRLDDGLCRDLRRRGLTVMCSPDVSVTHRPVPLWHAYLGRVHALGRTRGALTWRGRMPRLVHLLPVALLVLLLLGIPAGLAGGAWLTAWLGLIGLYVLAVLALGALTFILHRRLALVMRVMGGAVSSHLAFAAGWLRGLASYPFSRGR